MAVSVDTVYQEVLAIANKEQRGYITPQEFNLFARKAQLDIFESYFSDLRIASREPVLDTEYGDKEKIAKDKIAPFSVWQETATKPSGGESYEFKMPSNAYYIGNIYSTNFGETIPVNVNEVEGDDFHYLYKNNLLKPSHGRPIYVRAGNSIYLYPNGSTSYPWREETSVTTSTGEGDNVVSTTTVTQGNLHIDYVRKPMNPKWGYIIVNSKPLYNATTSTNFEMHESEEGSLVNRILELAGIAINKPGLSEVALRNEQMNQGIKNR